MASQEVHKGYLTKRGGMRKNWKKRYFRVYDQDCMKYFESEKSKSEKGKINFTTVARLEPSKVYNPFGITLMTTDRVWEFYADKEDSQKEWITAIRKAVGGSKSIRTYKEGSLTKQGVFRKNWKQRHFALCRGSLLYFENEADCAKLKSIHFFSEVYFMQAFAKFVRGSINLQNAKLAKVSIPQHNCCFTITTDHRIYKIECSGEKERDGWMKAIEEGKDDFSGGKRNKSAVKRPSTIDTGEATKLPEVQEKTVSAEELAEQQAQADRLKELKRVFDVYDVDASEELEIKELPGALEFLLGWRPSPQQVTEIVSVFDKDSSGTINFAEFVEMVEPKLVKYRTAFEKAEKARKVALVKSYQLQFNEHDKDGSKDIDVEEMQSALFITTGLDLSREEVAQVIQKYDKDGSGTLDFEEFLGMVDPLVAAERQKKRERAERIEAENKNKRLKKAFEQFAADGSLGRADVRKAAHAYLGFETTLSETEAALEDAGLKTNTTVSFDEFSAVLEPKLAGIADSRRKVEAAAAARADRKRKQEIKALFDKHDADGSGSIEPKELVGLLNELGVENSPDAVKEYMSIFDLDGSGALDFEEFVAYVDPQLEMAKRKEEIARRKADEAAKAKELKKAFDSIDATGDGSISTGELGNLLTMIIGFELPESDVAAILKKYDTDSDGSLSFAEFEKIGNGVFDDLARDAREAAEVIAERQRKERAGRIRKLFNEFDADGNGTISNSELMNAFNTIAGYNITEDEIKQFTGMFDHNADGKLDFQEFVSLIDPFLEEFEISAREKAQKAQSEAADLERRIRAEFNRIDSDRSGSLNREELEAGLEPILGYPLSKEETDAIFTGDAKEINFEEFRRLLEPILARARENARKVENQRVVQAEKERKALIQAAFQKHSEKNLIRAAGIRAALTELTTQAGEAIPEAQIDDLIFLLDLADPESGLTFGNFLPIADSIVAEATAIKTDKDLRQERDQEAVERETISRKQFDEIDTDKSGKISASELKNVMSKAYGLNLSDAEVTKLLAKIDKDSSGDISYEEFKLSLKPYLDELSSGHKAVMQQKAAGARRALTRVIRDQFDQLANEKGEVSNEQILTNADKLFSHAQLSRDDVSYLLDAFDANVVVFDELMAIVGPLLEAKSEAEIAEWEQNQHARDSSETNDIRAKIRAAFDKFDSDKSGELETKELAQVAASLLLFEPEEEELSRMVAYFDTDNSGTINFPEFYAMMEPEYVDVYRGQKSAEEKGERYVAPGEANVEVGQSMIKHGRKGKPKQRNVQIDLKKKVIKWGGFGSALALSDVKEIREGKTTDIFKRDTASSAPEDCCFSLVLAGKKSSLDLQAPDNESRGKWVKAITRLLADLDIGTSPSTSG